MPASCTVLIASADLLAALKPRAADGTSELLAFTDTDALRALEVITTRRPKLVTLERMFAATPRGAALIHRIKGDPALGESEIRVISHDTDFARVLPRRPRAGSAAAAEAVGAPTASTESTGAAPDQRGTRRAPRVKIAAKVEALIDGHAATLVDLSTVGAQVVSSSKLRPNQRVRVGLADQVASVRVNASVAWAKFEIPAGSGPRYRAGLDFVDPNHAALDAYCARNKA